MMVMDIDKTEESSFAVLLKRELVTSVGCTEPAAVAFAAASARAALGEEPERILIRASRDIIKNAMHAGIPHSRLKGIKASAALGIAGGDPSKELEIFLDLKPDTEQKALGYINSGRMSLELAEGVPSVFIEIRLEAGERSIAARVLNEHTRVEILENPKEEETVRYDAHAESGPKLELPGIYEYAASAAPEELDFLIENAEINQKLAKHSVAAGYGIHVGKVTREFSGSVPPAPEGLTDYLFRQGAALAAAASDARMAGCPMPVVINSGSGNQGIAISVPVFVLAEGLGRSREETARALCLAHLTALMFSAHKDRLSALCGAFTAAIGTAAGYTMLLGGSYDAIERCINNMVGNLIGIICDGAKGSCALKIYSCVEAAVMSVKLAITGHSIPAATGILGNDLNETLQIIKIISHEGMIPLDKTVLSLMIKKQEGVAGKW